jgi:hypothetical protein
MKKQILDLNGGNLSGANLIRADLSGKDLSGMNFYMAQLTKANLSEANLTGAELGNTDLKGANLKGAKLTESILFRANLEDADLRGARLSNADLRGANLNGADLREADFGLADLSTADLRGANLCDAKLVGTRLVASNFQGANLTGCRFYGAFTWNMSLQDTKEFDIVITPVGQSSTVAVDGVEVAQYVDLLLHNEKLLDILDTKTSNFALILGSFTAGRKNILNGIRNIVRSKNYIPISLDFGKPISCDFMDSLSALVHMTRFVIADFTDVGSLHQELDCIVSGLHSVRVVPVLQSSEIDRTVEHLKRYPWIQKIHQYSGPENLYEALEQTIIVSARPGHMN